MVTTTLHEARATDYLKALGPAAATAAVVPSLSLCVAKAGAIPDAAEQNNSQLGQSKFMAFFFKKFRTNCFLNCL